MKNKIVILTMLIIVCVMMVSCGKKIDKENITDDVTASEEIPMNNIIAETIEIPGLTKEYKFLYVTDAHLILLDGTESEELKQHAMERMTGFGQDNAFHIEEQFAMWLEEAEQTGADAVLLGGDTIDFPSDANINYLDEYLNGLEVPYLYTPGNHDWTYPWEYMTEYSKVNYLPKLNPYMQSDTAIHQLDFEEFVIVSVDNSTNQIVPEALETYRDILQKGKPVILMLHVPLCTQSALTKAKKVWDSGVVLGGGNHGGIYPDETSTEFINLTTAVDSPVVAVLAGHVHFYDKDMINGNIVQIVGDAGYKGSAMWINVKSQDN